MFRIFVVAGSGAVNVDNDEAAVQILSEGARELSREEIAAAGMTGYEHLVAPFNTRINEDGSVSFTPPQEYLSEAKAEALIRIDRMTSAAILSGFEYELDPGTGSRESLHFSYDAFDQQNFADTVNVALMVKGGASSLQSSVTWNAYRNYTESSGGELVRITLTPEEFLHLYTHGALVHKATQMEIGGQRKAEVSAASSVNEITALIAKWGV